MNKFEFSKSGQWLKVDNSVYRVTAIEGFGKKDTESQSSILMHFHSFTKEITYENSAQRDQDLQYVFDKTYH